jgi:hypothetical protein
VVIEFLSILVFLCCGIAVQDRTRRAIASEASRTLSAALSPPSATAWATQWPGWSWLAVRRGYRCRRRLLATTKSEDSVIAAEAMIGLRKPSAASGIAATLYPKAHPRLRH